MRIREEEYTRVFPNVCDPPIPYGQRMSSWLEHCSNHPYLAFLGRYPLHEPTPPRPMQSDQFAALVGSLLDPTHGPIVRDLLADLLAPVMAEVILTLAERGKP